MSKDQRNGFLVRAPGDLAEWAKQNAKSQGFKSRNHMVVACLEAARDGRLSIRPPNPQAFPADLPPVSEITEEDIATFRSILHKLENRHE